MGRGIFQYQCVYNSIEIQTTYFPSIMLEDDFIIEKKMLQDDLDLLEFMLGSMRKKKKKYSKGPAHLYPKQGPKKRCWR